MRALLFTAATALLLTQAFSCVRMELDAESDKSPAPAEQALQISAPDSVVLCPISAHLSSAGQTTIVWGGYPPGDDRLQLLQAQVSAQGLLLHPPQPLALLNNELSALEIQANDEGGLQVKAGFEWSDEILQLHLSSAGRLLETSSVSSATSRVADGCEIALASGNTRVRVFRAPREGEMPLFIEKSSR